jgi:hypothetical protein
MLGHRNRSRHLTGIYDVTVRMLGTPTFVTTLSRKNLALVRSCPAGLPWRGCGGDGAMLRLDTGASHVQAYRYPARHPVRGLAA